MIAPFQWLRKSQKFLCIHNSGLGRLPSSSPFLIFFDDEDDCMAKVGCWWWWMGWWLVRWFCTLNILLFWVRTSVYLSLSYSSPCLAQGIYLLELVWVGRVLFCAFLSFFLLSSVGNSCEIYVLINVYFVFRLVKVLCPSACYCWLWIGCVCVTCFLSQVMSQKIILLFTLYALVSILRSFYYNFAIHCGRKTKSISFNGMEEVHNRNQLYMMIEN